VEDPGVVARARDLAQEDDATDGPLWSSCAGTVRSPRARQPHRACRDISGPIDASWQWRPSQPHQTQQHRAFVGVSGNQAGVDCNSAAIEWLQMATDRQSDRLTSASGWRERAAQVRTRRTAPPDRPAAAPSSIQISIHTAEMNQRVPSAPTGRFVNSIRRSGHT
jgi:hypothetical protein